MRIHEAAARISDNLERNVVFTVSSTLRSNPHNDNIYVRGLHTRQGSKYKLVQGNADQLVDYDMLQIDIEALNKDRADMLQFETTRASRMCLVLHVIDPRVNGQIDQDPQGFKMKGPAGYDLDLGMANWDTAVPMPKGVPESESSYEPPPRGYVVCQQLPAGEHMLPGSGKIGAQYNVFIYSVLFGETDGSVPALTTTPPGWSGGDIKQHEKCPDALHDMWVVPGPDPNDPETYNMKWNTWHPQVDCLYNCYYGHEHGTPGMLAGYTERFQYTAFKNDKQDERHDGFKSHVMPVGDYFVVVNLHAGTNEFERINKDLHTMVIAVTDRMSGKLMSEISCKSSSGGAGADYAVRPSGVGVPLMLPMGDPASQQRTKDMWAQQNVVRVTKRVNLLNPNNMNPDLRYEGRSVSNTKKNRRGVYEGWFMQGLACMDQACTKKIILGLVDVIGRAPFYPNTGGDRFVEMLGLRIAPDLCAVDLPEPNADGYRVFYTNPTCEELCDGPGPTCVMQRIHESFKGVSVDNDFTVSDAYGHNAYEVMVNKAAKNGIAPCEGALVVEIELP
jgi:hypothetical protein